MKNTLKWFRKTNSQIKDKIHTHIIAEQNANDCSLFDSGKLLKVKYWNVVGFLKQDTRFDLNRIISFHGYCKNSATDKENSNTKKLPTYFDIMACKIGFN